MAPNTNPNIASIFVNVLDNVENLVNLFGGDREDKTYVAEYTLVDDLRIGQQIVLPDGEYTHVETIEAVVPGLVLITFATGESVEFLTNTQVRTK
jgi:hypothetical protein